MAAGLAQNPMILLLRVLKACCYIKLADIKLEIEHTYSWRNKLEPYQGTL
jgi:hypothetical protein